MVSSVSSYATLEAALSDKEYKVLFLDAWGVFWGGNAQGGFPGTQEALERLVASGKKIAIISNSSQLSQNEIKKYAARGFLEGKHFHFLITSGDLAKQAFSSGNLPFPTLQKKYILFCPSHPRYAPSSSLFEGSPFSETADFEEADFIYINVPHINGEDQEQLEAFSPLLQKFLLSKKPMVCANPDKFSHEGNPPRLVVRQGSIASLYKDMGGEVFYFGKPFPQIYSLAFDRLSPITKKEILMVGDTPETDIRGARSFGIKSALIIRTGIMAERIERQGEGAIEALAPTDTPDVLVERFAASACL